MHTMITDVAPLGPRCQAALPNLRLPKLQGLLRRLPNPQQMRATPDSLTPLAERLYAQALGLPAADGLVPWAALDASQRQLRLQPAPNTDASARTGSASAPVGWAWITPCHWQINSDHVAMHDPATLQLTAEESAALRIAMQPYFAEDGLALHPSEPGTWLACGSVLHQLPTAALARVSGDIVDRWLPRQAEARVLRRLQNEMQMLLYTHPVNAARSARGLPEVNSFWISGTGTLDGSQIDSDVVRLDALHHANQADDATAWTAAWEALDHDAIGPLNAAAERGEPVKLTLCGQQGAWQSSGPLMGRWQSRLNGLRTGRQPTLNTLLRTL